MSTNAAVIPFQMMSEPGKAFAAVREKSHVWLPLLALSLGTAAILYWYFATVDFAWLVEQMTSDPSLTDAQREAARKAMSPQLLTWSAVGGSLLGVPAVCALGALYYTLVGKFLGTEISFGKWFAFSVWTSIPQLLMLPLMALQIMTSAGRVTMEDLSMVSLNYLVFHLPPAAAWAGMLNSLNLTLLLTIPLTVAGLRVWTGRSLATCLAITLVAKLGIYVLWAAKIVVFS